MMKRRLKFVIPMPKARFRSICYKIQFSPIFDKIIIGFIIANLITMACVYKNIDSSSAYAIDFINNFCLAIYHLEALIKIIGIGPVSYFQDNSDK